MSTQKVTDESFETDVVQAQGPVLVDFWAEWCEPCKQIGPALEEIAAEWAGRLQVVKVNIDDNPGTPQRFNVRGIPTLMLFKDGKIVATRVGAMPKSKIIEWLGQSI